MKFLKRQKVDTAEVQEDIFTGNGQNTDFILTFTVWSYKKKILFKTTFFITIWIWVWNWTITIIKPSR